jgi:hypothetical protein
MKFVNPQSNNQKLVEMFLQGEGFKRTNVQYAFEDQLVTYELSRELGLTIHEYRDGGWDIGHGYARKERLSEIQEITEQLRTMHSLAGASRRTIVLEASPDAD